MILYLVAAETAQKMYMISSIKPMWKKTHAMLRKYYKKVAYRNHKQLAIFL